MDQTGNMETEDRMEPEGASPAVPDPRLPRRCCDEAARQNPERRSPVAMPNAQQSEQVTLKGRELALYQAGQLIGAAQAYRQLAQQMRKQAQSLESQAIARMSEGNAILSKVLDAANRGAKAGRRVVAAFKALTG
jgi:hypothetical protein